MSDVLRCEVGVTRDWDEDACDKPAVGGPDLGRRRVVSSLKQAARLAIADPPYPPRTCADGSRIARASRWYGDGQRSRKDSPADFHPDAARWDDPAEHRLLLEHLDATYDGWAIATTPDGLSAYGELPPAARIMAWVKRNGAAGSHRIRGCWEAVIVSPPPDRRGGNGLVEDVLIAGRPNAGFVGAKPALWVTWVLAALGHDPEIDTVDDLFPGTGIVSRIAAQGVISL